MPPAAPDTPRRSRASASRLITDFARRFSAGIGMRLSFSDILALAQHKNELGQSPKKGWLPVPALKRRANRTLRFWCGNPSRRGGGEGPMRSIAKCIFCIPVNCLLRPLYFQRPQHRPPRRLAEPPLVVAGNQRRVLLPSGHELQLPLQLIQLLPREIAPVGDHSRDFLGVGDVSERVGA